MVFFNSPKSLTKYLIKKISNFINIGKLKMPTKIQIKKMQLAKNINNNNSHMDSKFSGSSSTDNAFDD